MDGLVRIGQYGHRESYSGRESRHSCRNGSIREYVSSGSSVNPCSLTNQVAVLVTPLPWRS